MEAAEICTAAAAGLLPNVEDVDPATARMEGNYLVVSGRVAMPLDGVTWAIDRASDLPIVDELSASLGVLCLVAGRDARQLHQLTRYEYTALLADAPSVESLSGLVRCSRDYAIIEEAEFGRYIEHYRTGSAIWGGFSHGTSPASGSGTVAEIRARRGVISPTPHHGSSFRRLTRATGPREQFLRTYHTMELLFDYITYRHLVKAGDDLVDFGKIMATYQRAELARLRGIVREFCRDFDTIAATMTKLEQFMAPAQQMFQLHGKDGNPLSDESKWNAFRELIDAGLFARSSSKTTVLAKNDDAFDNLVASLAAYQIYRVRSSIAHNRIGEYLLTDADDAMIAGFGLPLLQEVAVQVFSSSELAALVT
jgi:hypothetical protein